MKRILFREPDRLAIAPLIDIAFLVLVFFLMLPLRHLDGKLEAHLPKERGWDQKDRDEPKDVVSIRLRGRGEDVVYGLGDRTAATPRDFTPTLRALGPQNIYEIHADTTVPWRAVVGVVDLLHGLRFPELQFRGGSRPGLRLRQTTPLPRPR